MVITWANRSLTEHTEYAEKNQKLCDLCGLCEITGNCLQLSKFLMAEIEPTPVIIYFYPPSFPPAKGGRSIYISLPEIPRRCGSGGG